MVCIHPALTKRHATLIYTKYEFQTHARMTLTHFFYLTTKENKQISLFRFNVNEEKNAVVSIKVEMCCLKKFTGLFYKKHYIESIDKFVSSSKTYSGKKSMNSLQLSIEKQVVK